MVLDESGDAASSGSPPDRPDEADLVERARGGDQHAFAELVRAHDHGLRMLAFRLLGDRDRMDDVLQEAYVKAYTGLPRFRGESSIGTWLYRVTYRACLDDMRRRKARPADPVPYEELAAHADARSGTAETAVRRVALARALAVLPPDQRAVVLLVDAQGFDYDSAAEILDVPRGTLGARLHRARRVLRELLAETQGGDLS